MLNPKNPNFTGKSEWMRVDTVCFIDKDGDLCFIPYGTMDWHFRTSMSNQHSFQKWFKRLKERETKNV
jgi:hypothetical protein